MPSRIRCGCNHHGLGRHGVHKRAILSGLRFARWRTWQHVLLFYNGLMQRNQPSNPKEHLVGLVDSCYEELDNRMH